MRDFQPGHLTTADLMRLLRLRFQRARTWDEINGQIVGFERRRFDDIATYMDRFNDLLVEMRCVDNFFTQECASSRSWQQFMSNCTGPDLREKLRGALLLDPAKQPSAIAFAQRWYDERGRGPWAAGYDAKKRLPKSKGSVNNVELEEGQPDDLEVNVVKTTKCTSCGKSGHDARSCLTSGKLLNIQPFRTEPAKKETKKEEKKCTFCNKKGHIQAECRSFSRAIREYNEAQTSRQGGAGNAPPPANNRGSNRGRGGRGNSHRGRGRGGPNRAVNSVNVNPEVGGSPEPPPVGPDPVQEN